MEQHEFDALVTRLEELALADPRSYTLRVLAVAALGLLILALVGGFALLGAALLVGLGVLVVATGGKALLLVAKLGKLVILLALPAWMMLKSAFTLLFARFPAPRGRELAPHEAPALFARIAELRRRVPGPPLHKVLLTDEINAAIVQHPRLGLLGWERNYLILGLPLLQILSEAEALAVVAHEYGHLSGHHSRLGGFVYRFRSAWGRLQGMSGQWDDAPSRLIARLFLWYGPYFNAYTFVLARQNEYLADRTAAEVAGVEPSASALMRTDIAARFADASFWPGMDRRAADQAEPPAERSTLWAEALRSGLDEGARRRLLEQAAERRTDHFDTHPALSDRLAALGRTVDAEAAAHLEPPSTSAAEAWLGAGLGAIRAEFDADWRGRIGERWRARHDQVQGQRRRLAELDRIEAPSAAERWERIGILAELEPEADPLPALEALLAADPGHLPARFRRGTLLLGRGDAAGIAELEAVMAAEPEAILAGCEAAGRFYAEQDPERLGHYRRRWQERRDHLDRVEAELAHLPVDADLGPADLGPEDLDAIGALLRGQGRYVTRVYLMRRTLRSDPRIHDYVLAFETPWLRLGNQAPKVIKTLAAQTWPQRTFIVHLGSKGYKPLRKVILRLKLAPLGFR